MRLNAVGLFFVLELESWPWLLNFNTHSTYKLLILIYHSTPKYLPHEPPLVSYVLYFVVFKIVFPKIRRFIFRSWTPFGCCTCDTGLNGFFCNKRRKKGLLKIGPWLKAWQLVSSFDPVAHIGAGVQNMRFEKHWCRTSVVYIFFQRLYLHGCYHICIKQSLGDFICMPYIWKFAFP